MRKIITASFISVILSVATTIGYYHIIVFKTYSSNTANSLDTTLNQEQVKFSPIKEERSIVKVLSYACRYCALSEVDDLKLKEKLPNNITFKSIYFAGENYLGRDIRLFATLKAMGVEEDFRKSAYYSVILENKELNDGKILKEWLDKNNIDRNEFELMSKSQEVEDIIQEMKDIVKHYSIQATPVYIINKKHVV
ncbi:thioredoxin domain-containing protein, partial [Salmonella enterica subsp. enterica serovar Newport]|nr:thioredoxin domain-containing protein [Salmonella enterica subsp. enterica serovar Newport]